MRKIIQLLLFLVVIAYAASVWALDAPVITAAAKGPNQINLTWSAVADAGYGYKIEIQSSADSRYSSWTEIATIPYWVTESHYKDPQDNTASQYPVFSLRNNTSYSFRVRSYKGDTSPAYSTYSNTATTTTRNYTPYYVNGTTGTDNSTCGTLASPCRTISYAINTRDLASSGRVIIISGGSYANDYIRPVRSGSAGVDNKIVIMAEPGSVVNITSSSTIPISISYNYVVIDGITVTSDYNDNMVYISGSYNALTNCEFDGSGNISWGPLVAGTYNLVHGVYSHDFGSANIDAGSAMQTVGSTTGANYNIIQYSLLRRGSHDTALTKNNASYNQWMNNIMDGGWGIGWAVVSDSYAACTNNLFEGNIIRDAAKNKTITNYKPGIQISGDYNTIRRNVIYDGNRAGTNSDPSPGIEISRLTGYGAHHNLIYNNAIYHNGGRAIVFMDGASQNDNIIANNIMYYNYGDTTYCPNSLNVHIRGVTTNTVVHHNQILYKDWTTGVENPNQANMILYSNICMSLSTSESTYGATFYNNVTATPDFVSEGSDFHLNSNSQLIDAGQVVVDSTWGTLSYKGSAPDLGAYEGEGGPPVPVLQFSSATYSVSESSATATVTVTRIGSGTGAVSVDYATSNGTATAGSDYTSANGTLSWADGETTSKTFTVSITNDTAVESSETINLALLNPTNGAVIGSQSTATLTILDDDGGGSGSGGDASASGGSGCGFVKEGGKGKGAKGEGLSFAVMLVITLCLLPIVRRLYKAFNMPTL
ncbi:MAG: right-handed parallel beta-helix repeat-containing protein [Nitrospirae bacterium]|nr:right-handed parallel beta-helix repeat-containing protein [Nitrospirota bacterium]